MTGGPPAAHRGALRPTCGPLASGRVLRHGHRPDSSWRSGSPYATPGAPVQILGRSWSELRERYSRPTAPLPRDTFSRRNRSAATTMATGFDLRERCVEVHPGDQFAGSLPCSPRARPPLVPNGRNFPRCFFGMTTCRTGRGNVPAAFPRPVGSPNRATASRADVRGPRPSWTEITSRRSPAGCQRSCRPCRAPRQPMRRTRCRSASPLVTAPAGGSTRNGSWRPERATLAERSATAVQPRRGAPF